MRHLVAARLAMSIAVVSAAPARADKDTVVTLGLGSESVVGRCAGIAAGAPSNTFYGQDVNLRLRLLWILGLEASYAYSSDHGRTDLAVAAPSFRIAGQIFFTAKSRVAPYLALGVGASDIHDLVSVSGPTSSYHAGLGVEVAITKHWLLDGNFRLDMPNYRNALDRDPKAFASWDHFRGQYNFDTWQVGVGARYYL